MRRGPMITITSVSRSPSRVAMSGRGHERDGSLEHGEVPCLARPRTSFHRAWAGQDDSDRLIVPAVAGQLNEMELIKSKIYQLEQTHLAMKNK